MSPKSRVWRHFFFGALKNFETNTLLGTLDVHTVLVFARPSLEFTALFFCAFDEFTAISFFNNEYS